MRQKISELRIDPRFSRRLPAPSDDEHGRLLESIREHGILVPLVVTSAGLLLDGHRRLECARELGIENVPVVVERCARGKRSVERALSVLVNLDRRHLNEAQRASLGSSLLRIERVRAKERMLEGGKRGGRGKKKPSGDGTQGVSEEPDLATARVARRVGISRQTFERVERVKRENPRLARDMLEGRISVAGAAAKVKIDELKRRTVLEVRSDVLAQLSDGAGKFRTIYEDPPWPYSDTGTRGAAAQHYPTSTVDELLKLSQEVSRLAHPEGCHRWTWTTWPMIRDGLVHRYLTESDFRWVGEIVWHKTTASGESRIGVGRWLRPVTEILVLSVKGSLPLLDQTNLAGFVAYPVGEHSVKPIELTWFVERLSPGPRIELFARRSKPREGWSYWGIEA